MVHSSNQSIRDLRRLAAPVQLYQFRLPSYSPVRRDARTGRRRRRTYYGSRGSTTVRCLEGYLSPAPAFETLPLNARSARLLIASRNLFLLRAHHEEIIVALARDGVE